LTPVPPISTVGVRTEFGFPGTAVSIVELPARRSLDVPSELVPHGR
jgi:hypothetical protein